EAVILIGEARQIDTGDPAGATGMGADLPHLPLEREHVGIEPQVQHHAGVPFLRRGVFLGLPQHSLKPAKQLQAYRHKAAVHRDRHGDALLMGLSWIAGDLSPRQPADKRAERQGLTRTYTPAEPGACVMACRIRPELGEEFACWSFHSALSGTAA